MSPTRRHPLTIIADRNIEAPLRRCYRAIAGPQQHGRRLRFDNRWTVYRLSGCEVVKAVNRHIHPVC